MHKIRPFIQTVRKQEPLEQFPDEKGRIGFVHGCVRELAGDAEAMVAFTLEYFRQCNMPATRNDIDRYLEKLTTDRLLRAAVEQLIRKGIVTEDTDTQILTLHIP